MPSLPDHNRHVIARHWNPTMDITFAPIPSARVRITRATVRATVAMSALTLAACSGARPEASAAVDSAASRVSGVSIRVRDTVVATTFDASGVAAPLQQATLSTKLMGTVQEVLVHEGDAVRNGQVLLRIDARELTAKATQVASSIADAEALQQDAATHATRIRALYADSAATRAQLDAVESGLVRANAGVRAARAAASELEAMASYATVRAPFTGIVTGRLADAGTFAAPGTPLLIVQDISALRISASVAANGARTLQRGQQMHATIDGVPVTARVEGVVPTNAGNLFTVNAIVANARGIYRAGSAAVLLIPAGEHHALLVPLGAIVRDGDLTGVVVRGAARDERRWVRLGASNATHVEITSGLRAGEEIVLPTTSRTDGTSIKPGA